MPIFVPCPSPTSWTSKKKHFLKLRKKRMTNNNKKMNDVVPFINLPCEIFGGAVVQKLSFKNSKRGHEQKHLNSFYQPLSYLKKHQKVAYFFNKKGVGWAVIHWLGILDNRSKTNPTPPLIDCNSL
jgi:hypothetical protein